MKTSLVISVLVCALSCSVAGDPAKTTDQAMIQGAWLAQTERQNGTTRNVSYLYVFKGDEVIFRDETGKEMKYSFRLDTSGNPRLMIIQPVDTVTDTTAVGVAYELKENSLKIVVAPAGSRPTEISDKNNQELIICKRKDP